jgi:hypothetical protein
MVGLADLFRHGSKAGPSSGGQCLRPWELVVLLGILCGITGCNNDTSDATAETLKCARKQYANYDPKIMKQCVDVCIGCERGSMTTCSTSCTMKGAK